MSHEEKFPEWEGRQDILWVLLLWVLSPPSLVVG